MQRVVGIGASAGGLESLEQLFAALPASTGMAFVVVQHLSPDFRSLMPELIARHTQMPVVVAENGVRVEANSIYLMPPGKEMIIRDGRLVLTDKEPHTFSLPIDAFFRSLAQDVGPNAVAAVLSGTGSDGSRGIVDVHRAGGLVLAESTASAKFDGMPMSAAATGVVDHIHAPSDLARVLCGLPPLESPPEIPPMSDDPALDAVLRLLRDGFGIDFTLYKTGTVSRRIQRRVDLLRIRSLDDYAAQVQHDPDELNKLYQDLLIGVTGFFRDPEAFALLEREVIPKLLDAVKPEEELRVWVAGCATGEEAYSLAMLFYEQYQARERAVKLKVLATDVHQRSLDIASTGVYGEEQLAHVSTERMQRFFTRRSAGFQISQDLRQLIVFARHNLTKDAPFTKMHLISCRNMLIYLQPPAQRTVLSLFHFGLAPQGFLFLGASETPGVLGDEFTTINDHWKVFRKRRDVHLLSSVELPVIKAAPKPSVLLRARPAGPDPLVLATYDQLLDLFMPPGFLVDEERVLLESFAGAERMLRLRRRRPSTNLLELLDDELRTVVAGAIQRAERDNTVVSYRGVPIETVDGPVRCTVAAQPLRHPRTGSHNVLITFRDMTPVSEAHPTVDLPVSQASRERMTDLEAELAYTRETLQSTIEELETANEELQATNEELVASNEELQSTNEELHSVNEELYTVNAEYQQKITELKQLNADMTHLLEGTDVGTVFLDHELKIRRFTSRMASVFRFQPTDIGRHLGDFSHNIARATLMTEIESALADGRVTEDEVRDRGGTPYFLRILPYRVQQIEGVVLTLTDMTALDRVRSRVEQLSAIVAASDDAIFALAPGGTISAWNRGSELMFGYSADEAIGRDAGMLVQPGSGHQLAFYLRKLEQGQKVEHVSALCMRADGTRVDVLTTLSPIYENGVYAGVSAVGRDVSRILEAQRALESEQQKVRQLLEQAQDAARMRERFLAMLSHELRNPLAAVMAAVAALRQAPEVGDRARAVIDRQARQMKRLLDDILDVSRITSDKLVIDKADVELRDVVDTAIESTAPVFEERRVRLVREVPMHAVAVNGDGKRLVQIFANLLSNAAAHSSPGSMVRIALAVHRNTAEVTVTDHGLGIDPAMQARIFDLFVQGEQQLDRARGGLGVGLSLAKTIAELHGGTIAVRSAGLGRGSAFTVTLPLGQMRERAITQGVPGGPCRIVLVDDQDDSRSMLRALFESKQHVVFDGADGPAAIALIEAHKPDVAFIDIGLPRMNGFEVAQQIRKRRELDAVLLVALTGYGGDSDIEAARAAGFDEHVTKPAELDQLQRILERKKPLADA